MIITIDGPSASGKSTIAHALAQRLGYFYINSGFMYRSLAYVLIEKFHTQDFAYITDELLQRALEHIAYSYVAGKVVMSYDREEITDFLKNSVIDRGASILSSYASVRELITAWQRHLADKYRNAVVEGRDAGTIVFPDAAYKFFITASAEVRALRWQKDQLRTANSYTFNEALYMINERDLRDSQRAIAPLTRAPGALVIDNSDLSIDEQLVAMQNYIGTTCSP